MLKISYRDESDFFHSNEKNLNEMKKSLLRRSGDGI